MKEYVLRNARVVTPTTVMHGHVLVRDGLVADVDEGDINIGISVQKGNTGLKDAIDSALAGMTADDFNAIMEDAIKIQPLSE